MKGGYSYLIMLPTGSKTVSSDKASQKLSREHPAHVCEVTVFERRGNEWEKVDRVWLKDGQLVEPAEDEDDS